MTTMHQVSIGMFTNVLVTLGCVFLLTRALPYLTRLPTRLRSLSLGIMFGGTVVASMLTAFPISEGIFGDMRNAIIAIAALSGGPIAAIVCAAFAVLFRIAMGGQFVGATSAILLCALLSIAFQWAPIKRTKTNLALFGVALAVLNALVPFLGWLMGTTPFATVIAVAEAIFGAAILFYPASIVLVAGLIAAELRRLDTEAGLRVQNAELTLSERRFLNVFDVSCIPMAWLDLKTRKFVRVNRQYEVFTGYSADELLHMTIAELSVPADEHADLAAVQALASGDPSWQGERRYRCKDGSIRWGTRTLIASDEDGEPRFGFAIVEDITERKLAGEQIAYLAEHDHLTGLTNRFQFGKSLERALADASSTPTAVIVIDLDDFKGVNDTRGEVVPDFETGA
ncbi:PAS domain S-box protein [Mesorhizobium sp. INR15]|uniref:PAS domain S-box protein n=1 Tax=Mesorhizobium sp. INR15 TaxID=2654248 RepID=UPI001896662A|nr:PAS domain S-box protein [Mesorhizobium sp. INR15]QPC95919.1 PAS domain S-box protein [Mesorhizobium sp. INR15]